MGRKDLFRVFSVALELAVLICIFVGVVVLSFELHVELVDYLDG
jgi:hypothetical protein